MIKNMYIHKFFFLFILIHKKFHICWLKAGSNTKHNEEIIYYKGRLSCYFQLLCLNTKIAMARVEKQDKKRERERKEEKRDIKRKRKKEKRERGRKEKRE